MIGAAATPTPGNWRQLADLSDERLVERLRVNDALAFEALMRRHNRRIFRIARSVLNDPAAAEDAVQETFLALFTNLHRYSAEGKFGAWLARIALNQALTMRRQRMKNSVSMEDAELEAGDATASAAHPLSVTDRHAEALHARALVERAVDALPDALRPVYMLRLVEGLSGAETAACLDLNPTTVRTRLHRAQKLMRAHIAVRLDEQGPQAFDFDGERCDRIVAAVLARASALVSSIPEPGRAGRPTGA